MAIIKIEDIAHVRFAAPDLGAMRSFRDDFGMHTFEAGGRLYGKGSDGRPFVHVTEPGEARFLAVGFRAEAIERALREPDPQRFIGVLRDCGALQKLLPELDRLFGVPQPAEPHPEIDTGVHVLMVLEQAARLSDDPQVRFAALLHDLGKGTTPPGEWPRHHGHEARSVELVNGLCARLKVPAAYRELALAVARDHGNAHRAFELREREAELRAEPPTAARRHGRERIEQVPDAGAGEAVHDPYAQPLRRARATASGFG